ncbi:MAG: PilZ domain [Deltaproteobacteria bacterium]|nr:PilZ domain [Deltaproteobacteria bacterium]
MGDRCFEARSGGAERRHALRVPVRGIAVLHPSGMSSTADAPLHGQLENLSQSGALVNVRSKPGSGFDVEFRLPASDVSGWVSAHAVRVERAERSAGWRVAVAFDRVEPVMQDAIEQTITAALFAAHRRPVLVIDDHTTRRDSLIARLVGHGMTPLAPKTPLDVVDLLTRGQLHVSVCLLAPGFGVPTTDLAAILSDSFPWVTTAEITDDLEATAGRAIEAWSTTPVAQLATAIG